MQRDPVREWREQYARCCLRVDFEPLPGTTFHASVKPIFPELRIIRAASSPGFVFRDEDLLRDGNDSFELLIAQSRTNLRQASGTRYTAWLRRRDDDAGSARPARRLTRAVRVTWRCWFHPKNGTHAAAVPTTRLCNTIGSNSDALKLLRGYIRSLESSALASSVEGRVIVRRHMLDLAGHRRNSPPVHW